MTELVLSGADIVKLELALEVFVQQEFKLEVVIQLSAVIECADAAHGLGAHIIADGRYCAGDVAKGFGGGRM